MATRNPRPPGPGAPPKGRTLLHGVGGRNPLVLLAGGGAVVVLVVAMVHRSSAGSGSGSSTSTTVPNTYDSTLSDIEAQWENQFETLQGEIANLNPTPTTGPPAGGGAPTPKPPTQIQGGSPPRSTAPPVAAHPISQTQAIVRVQSGNTLSGIAAKFGETWQQVWAYNLRPGVRPAATDKILQARGPNNLVTNEEILIPRK